MSSVKLVHGKLRVESGVEIITSGDEYGIRPLSRDGVTPWTDWAVQARGGEVGQLQRAIGLLLRRKRSERARTKESHSSQHVRSPDVPTHSYIGGAKTAAGEVVRRIDKAAERAPQPKTLYHTAAISIQ